LSKGGKKNNGKEDRAGQKKGERASARWVPALKRMARNKRGKTLLNKSLKKEETERKPSPCSGTPTRIDGEKNEGRWRGRSWKRPNEVP